MFYQHMQLQHQLAKGEETAVEPWTVTTTATRHPRTHDTHLSPLLSFPLTSAPFSTAVWMNTTSPFFAASNVDASLLPLPLLLSATGAGAGALVVSFEAGIVDFVGDLCCSQSRFFCRNQQERRWTRSAQQP